MKVCLTIGMAQRGISTIWQGVVELEEASYVEVLASIFICNLFSDALGFFP
jgi:hypothetical protein